MTKIYLGYKYVPVDEDTEALPVTAADVDGFITKSLDEVDIFS